MEDSNIIPTTRHVLALASAYANAGNLKMVLKIFEGLKLQTPTLLKYHDRNSTFILKPVKIDLILINSILHAFVQGNNFEKAKEILEHVRNGLFFVENTRNGVKAKDVIYPDEVTYNTVLRICSDSLYAKNLLKEMRLSRRHRIGQAPPTARSYALAIDVCRRTNDWDTAEFLLQDCRHDGITPNIFMYSAAIWTAERRSLPYNALDVLKQMNVNGCKPNEFSYNGVLSAFAAIGGTQIALKLFSEMKSKGITTSSRVFSHLMHALKNSNKEMDAICKLDFLESVIKLMTKDDFLAKVSGPVLQALILEYGMNERFDDAFKIFNMIIGPVNGPCLRAMMSACALSRRWKEAISILHTSDIVKDAQGPTFLDKQALSYAILACSKSGEFEEAINLLDLYGRSFKVVGDNRATVTRPALNSLIASCGRGERPDLALKILNEMQSLYGVKPDQISYRSAAIACNRAEHKHRRPKNVENERKNYTSTLHWWECSLSLLRRMNEEEMEPDEQTCSSIISSCHAAGEWQRALGVLRQMMSDKRRLNLFSFNAAISACAEGGAWVEALELYYQMHDLGGPVTPNFVTISSILIALESGGQRELAQTIYKESLEKKIVQPWTSISEYSRNNHTTSKIMALDLHNFSTAMTRVAIRHTMDTLLDKNTEIRGVSDATFYSRGLLIITGKGNRSESNHPVLMPTVQTVLKNEYNISSSIDPKNTGILVVEPSELHKFIAKQNSWLSLE